MWKNHFTLTYFFTWLDSVAVLMLNWQQIFFKNGPTPASFSIFSVFSNKQYNFYNNSMWKMSCPSSIQRRDSNPRPLEHKMSPITTRPGLPSDVPNLQELLLCLETFTETFAYCCSNNSKDVKNRIETMTATTTDERCRRHLPTKQVSRILFH